MSTETSPVLSQSEDVENVPRLTRSKAGEGKVELKLKPLRMPLDELVNDEEDDDYNPIEEDDEEVENDNEEDVTIDDSMREEDVNVSQLEAEASAPLRFDVAPEMLRTKTPEYVEFVQKVFKEKLDETNDQDEDPDYSANVDEDEEINVEEGDEDEGGDQIEIDEESDDDEDIDDTQDIDVSVEIPKEEVDELHNDVYEEN